MVLIPAVGFGWIGGLRHLKTSESHLLVGIYWDAHLSRKNSVASSCISSNEKEMKGSLKRVGHGVRRTMCNAMIQ